jgi:hypothetical protein
VRDTFSAVRYEAEAGISRHGWVPGLEREERLITERREGGGDNCGGGGVPSTSSSEDGLGVDAGSPDGGPRCRASSERDEMKWPMESACIELLTHGASCWRVGRYYDLPIAEIVSIVFLFSNTHQHTTLQIVLPVFI